MLVLAADVNVPAPMPHGHAVGIDLGLLSFIATSDGETIHRPKFYVDAQSQRRLGYVCWKRGVYFARVQARETSQTCPACGTHTGKRLWLNRSTIAITVAMKRTET